MRAATNVRRIAACRPLVSSSARCAATKLRRIAACRPSATSSSCKSFVVRMSAAAPISLNGVTDEDKVVAAVAPLVWTDGDASPGGVTLDDKSGRGGGKVYFLSKPGAEPGRVVLKVSAGDVGGGPLTVARYDAALSALRDAGVTPKPIASGPDWEAVPFVGAGCMQNFFTFDETKVTAGELGKTIASVHQVPIGWYEPHRKAAVERDAALGALLKNLPAGSHGWDPTMWGFESGMPCLGANFPHQDKAREILALLVGSGALAKYLGEPAFLPASEGGKRVVTLHGDFKPDNILWDEATGALPPIDFELCHVGPAAADFGFAMMFFLGAHRVPYAFRFNLLQSYLEACGLDATEASVRALMLDAEVATLTSLPGMLGTVNDGQVPLLRGMRHPTAKGGYVEASEDGVDGAMTVALLAAAVGEVRASPMLTDAALREGLVRGVLHARKAGAEALWTVLDDLQAKKLLFLYGVPPAS